MLSMEERIAWLKRPRIIDFYDSLVAKIPCYPDTLETREQLASMSLSDVLVRYVNFVDRFIPPRARTISWAKDFWDAPHAHAQMDKVFEIAREIEQGIDLKKRLSARTLKVGFAPDAENRWEDKDFALNAYDVHHLHLGQIDKDGQFKHADPLLFLTVSRDQAHMLMLGTHRSFGDRSLEKVVAAERARAGFTIKGILPPRVPENLDVTHRMARVGFATSTTVDNEVVPLSMLVSSGHRVRSVRYADQVFDMLLRFEGQIDAPDFATKTLEKNARRIAAEPEFVWRMEYLDLSLIELKSRIAFVFLKGAH